MKTVVSKTTSLNELRLWEADKRLLPGHLRTSDNTRRIEYYKKALRLGFKTQLSETQREYLNLFYGHRLTKTEIGKRHGIGSSSVCKIIKSAEKALREFIELYMQIYDLLVKENVGEDDENVELRGG